MNADLVLLAKGGRQKSFRLPGQVTVIGRQRSCDLRVPLPSVSRRHCQLSYNGAGLIVRDLGSRNGTLLNGRRIEEETIEAGDFLQIGEVLFAVRIDGQPETITPPAVPPEPPLGEEDTALSDFNAPDENDNLPDLDSLDDLDDLDDANLDDLDDEEIDLDAL